MPRPKKAMPAYRYHVSGQAVVTLGGKDFYLGPHNSSESHAKYLTLVAEYQRNGLKAPEQPAHQKDVPVTVAAVTAEFRSSMTIEVCHYPPGTSKWNKIEHRLFCQITRNWRGVPLETHQVVVNLVSSTRTAEGLEVHCRLDANEYAKGRKVTDEEMDDLRIKRNAFHGDWNYEIRPHL